MALNKRNDQSFVGQDITDITGASDSLDSLSAAADNFTLYGLDDNNKDAYVSQNGTTFSHPNKIKMYYDFATDGGAVGDIVLRGSGLPSNARVTRTYYEVTTAFTSGGSATIALNIPTDDAAGLLAATAIGTAGTAGAHDGIQDGAAANFSELTTAVRVPTMSVGTADLTAGALVLVLEYEVFNADTSS